MKKLQIKIFGEIPEFYLFTLFLIIKVFFAFQIATSYREFMKDVVQVFSATSVEANLFANEMFFFERQLAEVLPPTSELSDTRTHQMLTISHLRTIASAVTSKNLSFV